MGVWGVLFRFSIRVWYTRDKIKRKLDENTSKNKMSGRGKKGNEKREGEGGEKQKGGMEGEGRGGVKGKGRGRGMERGS